MPNLLPSGFNRQQERINHQLEKNLGKKNLSIIAKAIENAKRSIPVIPGEGRQQAEALSKRIGDTVATVTGLTASLERTVTDNARETIDRLELALTRTYKIAVFIRGDYDRRDDDEEQKKTVLANAVIGFNEVDERATLGLKTIGDIHAKVLDIQYNQITPMRNEVAQLINQNKIQVDSIKSQMGGVQTSLSGLDISLRNEEAAMKSLQDKVSKNKTASTASDIGMAILTGPIGIFAGKGKPPDPLGLRKQLEQSRARYAEAQAQRNATAGKLVALQQQYNDLQQRKAFAEHLQATLPQTEQAAANLETQSVALQSQFAHIKDTASKLLSKVKNVESRAIVAQATVLTKREFAVALFEICDLALIDDRLIDEAQMIAAEIMSGYGTENTPAEITEGNETVKNKVELVKAT